MADNVTADPGSGGAVFATDDVSSVHYPISKITIGALDSAGTLISGGNGATDAGTLRVTISSDSTGVVSIDDNGGSLTIDGTVTANLSATDNAVLDSIDAAVNGTITVGSHAVTNAGTFVVQEDGALLTAAQLIDDCIYADDAAFTLTSSKVAAVGAIRDDSLSALTAIEGDVVPFRVDSTGALHVTGGGGGTEYSEDVATPATIVGTATMVERDDALTTVTPIEGDWIGLRGTAEGALWVQDFNSDAILTDTGTIAGDTTSIDGKITACDTGAVTISAVTPDLMLGTDFSDVLGTASLVLATQADALANTVDTVQTSALAYVFNGTTWDRVREGGEAGSILVDLGANNDVTVTGTVTVDLGANNDVINAGTFAVQEDGAALTALQLIDDSIFADDAAFTLASSKVTVSGAIRDDTLSTLTAIEGDAVPLRVSSTGALHVTGGGGGTEYSEDVATPATIVGSAVMVERDDALGALTPIEGDWASLRCDANGALWVIPSGTVTVDGSGVTQPISAASLPLPTGAATEATLGTIDTDTGNIAAGYATEGSALGSGVLIQGDDGTDRTNVLVDTSGHLQVDVLSGGGGTPNVVSTNNSSTATLGISGVFTGTGDDVSSYAAVTIQVDASHDSATNGMQFQFSTDNTNWDDTYDFSYTAADGARRFQFPVTAQYFRCVYTNGGTGQSHFRMQTILHGTNVLTSIHQLSDDTHPDRSAQVVKAAIIAQAAGAGDFVPVQATNGGNLKMSLSEVSDGADIGAGNAGTETIRVSVSTDDVNLSAIKTAVELIDNAISGTEMQVDIVTSALPTGAATAAAQLPDGHNVTIDNASGGSAVNIQDGGNSITIDGTVTANLSTTDNTVLDNIQTAVELVDNAIVAHDAAVSGSTGVNISGFEARSTEPTAVADADASRGISSLLGKQVTLPYAIPASTWQYASVAGGVTDTADDAAKAAGGAGVRNYVTSCQVVNGHASVSTEVVIKDGSTVIWRGWAEAGGGGVSAKFDPPLRGTANTAINVTNITTGSATYFNLQGFVAAE